MCREKGIQTLILFIIGIICVQIDGCKKIEEIAYISDVDGNQYGVVIIGSQTWMKANLRTTKYNDGASIPNITDGAEWGNLISDAFCWNFNDPSFKSPFGALYNWYAINNDKLCPVGWHVATDQDWTELINYLGGFSIAGGKLKEPGTVLWYEPNIGATNETGFTAVPGGSRYVGDLFPSGTFTLIGVGCTWWSSSEYSSSDAIYFHVMNSSIHIERYHKNKGTGLSVRCLKD